MSLPSDALFEADESRLTSNARGLPSDALFTTQPTQVEASVRQALPVNPDEAAAARRIARDESLPLGTAERNLPQLQAEARLRRASELAAGDPVLARQLADPGFAKIAHDDVEGLSTIGRAVRFLGNSGAALGASLPGANAALAGAAAAPFEIVSKYLTNPLVSALPFTTNDPAAQAADYLRRIQRDQGAFGKDLRRDENPNAGDIEKGYYSGLQSLGQNLLTLPAAVALRNLSLGAGATGAQATAQGMNAALLPMSVMTGGEAYGQARDKGVDPLRAATFGASQGVIEYWTEGLALGKLLQVGAPFVKRALGFAGNEVVGEQIATLLQDMNEWAVLNPQKTLGDYAAERPSAAVQTFVATLVGAGGQVAVTSLAERAMRTDRVTQAEEQWRQLDALHKLAQASKVAQRDPQTFGEFVQAVAEDGPVQELYVDARVLMQTLQQAGVDATVLPPEVQQSLPEAVLAGGDVRIKVGDFATMAQSDLSTALLPHLKTEDGISQAEAQTFLQTQAEEFRAQVEKTIAAAADVEAARAEIDTVRENIRQQLAQANRFTAQVNEVYAQFAANFYATMAKRAGMTPTEMAARYPLSIAAEGVAGGNVMDQGAEPLTKEAVDSFAESLRQAHGVHTLDLQLLPSGDVRLDTIAVERTGTGAGTKAMQALVGWADQQGVRITLGLAEKGYQPIEDGPKTSSGSRLREFYKRFGFVDNKGRNKDFRLSISDTMYRRPAGTLNQPAYHGSPHDFPRFSLDYIGTGEGAQAYGWGLYFAENLGIAIGYRNRLTAGGYTLNGVPYSALPSVSESPERSVVERFVRATDPRGDGLSPAEAVDRIRADAAESLAQAESNLADARANLGKTVDMGEEWGDMRLFTYDESAVVDAERAVAYSKEFVKLAKKLKAGSIAENKGALYQVEIPDGAVAMMLDWDKPLSEQAPGVQAAIAENFGEHFAAVNGEEALLDMTGAEVYAEVSYASSKRADFTPDPRAGSLALLAAGIPGIKYLDGNSRADGSGTRNLVVFDDKLVTITHKNGEPVTAEERRQVLEQSLNPQAGARGQISFGADIKAGATITILKNADLSTFHHELGHFFLEVLVDLATQPSAPADIVADANAVMKWFGIKATKPPKGGEQGGELGQGPPDTNAFQRWTEGAPVVRAEDTESYDGGPAVFEGFHGTTHTGIEKVNTNPATGSAEGYLGVGFYVTTSRDDASSNYAGMGPDLTGRVRRRAEEIGSSWGEDQYVRDELMSDFLDANAEARAEVADRLDIDAGFDYRDLTEQQKERAEGMYGDDAIDHAARAEVAGESQGLVMPVWVKILRPFDIRPSGTTLSIDYETNEDGDIVDGSEKGSALDFIEALRNTGEAWGVDVSAVVDFVYERALDGVHAHDIWRQAEKSIYAETDPDGRPASLGQFVQEVAREAGYDGFVMDADLAFGSARRGFGGARLQGMAGVEPGTLHLMPFDGKQVKSALGNRGTYDPNDPNILKQSDETPAAPAELPAGATPLEVWRAMSLEEKRPYHEQFARGYEAFLLKGESPTVEMQGFFSRVKAWMKSVYQSIKALNVKLTPEVEGVYSRLLATEEQIKLSETLRAYAPMFASQEAAGATVEEWRDYQALHAEATERATTELERKSLADLKWLANARSKVIADLQKQGAEARKKVEAEVTAEVRAMPVYAVQRFLRYGELDQNVLLGKGVELAGKLDLAALKEMYGDGPAAPWRYLAVGKNGLAATEGLHPDLVAELFGFRSGDHLVREILAADPEAVMVEGMTDQRMLEQHGELVDEQMIATAADRAVHNEARARAIAAELRFLARSATKSEKTPGGGSVNVLAKAAKDFAEQIIGRKALRDIKPTQFVNAEARAAKAALTAKTPQEQAVEKRNQLVNFYAAKVSTAAVAEIEKGIRYLKKFDVEGTRKNIDPEYLEQIDQILERYDLRPASGPQIQKRKALAEWIAAQRAQGLEPTISEALQNEASRQHYSTLSFEDFRGLVDAVKNIDHLGRLKKKLLLAADERELQAVVAELQDSIVANAVKVVPERRSTDRGWLVKPGELWRGFLAEHRKFASLAREMDGFKDGGPVWDVFVRRMNDRGTWETARRAKESKRLADVFAALPAKYLAQKVDVPDVGRTFTREELIGVALNMGNETNRERVLTGEAWTPYQLEAVLSHLTPEDARLVQKVWDYLGSFRAEIGAKSKRVTGVEPEWVAPNPVTIAGVQLRGGYYPIAYDPKRGDRADANDAAAIQQQLQRGLFTRAQTRRGHLEERSKSTGMKLRYDLDVIGRHVNQVVHDLAWHEYLIDANRVLPKLEGVIFTHYGADVFKQLKNALRDIAVGDIPAAESIDRVFRHLRTGATVVGLGWNVVTSMLQPFGITQTAARLGIGWTAKGVARFIGDAARMESTVAWVREKSKFMQVRGLTQQREVNEILNKVTDRDSPITRSYFWMIQAMQTTVDVPTWVAAYEKAMAEGGMTEEKAVALADQAVIDTQGDGQIQNLSSVQRGSEFKKLWTNFYSFFNTTYNLAVERGKVAARGNALDMAKLPVDYALLYIVPAALSFALKEALKFEPGDDDPEKLAKKLLAEQLNYLLGSMVGLRELGEVFKPLLGIKGNDYSGPAGARFIAEMMKLGKQVGQGELDEGLAKSAANVAGILLHLPAGQVARTLDGIHALLTERTQNPGALLVGSQKNN